MTHYGLRAAALQGFGVGASAGLALGVCLAGFALFIVERGRRQWRY